MQALFIRFFSFYACIDVNPVLR